jgi:5-methylcytosine-specific restriction protein A
MTRAEFSRATKRKAWDRAGGCCQCQSCPAHQGRCGISLHGKVGHYDHIIAETFSHDSSLGNCQLLCVNCHDRKTAKQDIPAIAKSNRIRVRHAGIRRPRTILTGRKMDGTPVKYSRER